MPVQFWGVENEGEHLPRKGAIQAYTQLYDAIISSIRQHEVGTEAPMRFVAVNQHFADGTGGGFKPWLLYFLNRSNHVDPDHTPIARK